MNKLFDLKYNFFDLEELPRLKPQLPPLQKKITKGEKLNRIEGRCPVKRNTAAETGPKTPNSDYDDDDNNSEYDEVVNARGGNIEQRMIFCRHDAKS